MGREVVRARVKLDPEDEVGRGQEGAEAELDPVVEGLAVDLGVGDEGEEAGDLVVTERAAEGAAAEGAEDLGGAGLLADHPGVADHDPLALLVGLAREALGAADLQPVDEEVAVLHLVRVVEVVGELDREEVGARGQRGLGGVDLGAGVDRVDVDLGEGLAVDAEDDVGERVPGLLAVHPGLEEVVAGDVDLDLGGDRPVGPEVPELAGGAAHRRGGVGALGLALPHARRDDRLGHRLADQGLGGALVELGLERREVEDVGDVVEAEADVVGGEVVGGGLGGEEEVADGVVVLDAVEAPEGDPARIDGVDALGVGLGLAAPAGGRGVRRGREGGRVARRGRVGGARVVLARRVVAAEEEEGREREGELAGLGSSEVGHHHPRMVAAGCEGLSTSPAGPCHRLVRPDRRRRTRVLRWAELRPSGARGPYPVAERAGPDQTPRRPRRLPARARVGRTTLRPPAAWTAWRISSVGSSWTARS